jgi:hypothetical protein
MSQNNDRILSHNEELDEISLMMDKFPLYRESYDKITNGIE